jgi:hypothetical protein
VATAFVSSVVERLNNKTENKKKVAPAVDGRAVLSCYARSVGGEKTASVCSTHLRCPQLDTGSRPLDGNMFLYIKKGEGEVLDLLECSSQQTENKHIVKKRKKHPQQQC